MWTHDPCPWATLAISPGAPERGQPAAVGAGISWTRAPGAEPEIEFEVSAVWGVQGLSVFENIGVWKF